MSDIEEMFRKEAEERADHLLLHWRVKSLAMLDGVIGDYQTPVIDRSLRCIAESSRAEIVARLIAKCERQFVGLKQESAL